MMVLGFSNWFHLVDGQAQGPPGDEDLGQGLEEWFYLPLHMVFAILIPFVEAFRFFHFGRWEVQTVGNPV